jgi:hypothetical protein
VSRVVRVAGLTAAAVILVALAVAGARYGAQHWIAVHTGTVNESGPYYGFWSGFGSDLGEATIVVGIVGAYHHHNCHVKGCPRLGHQVEGTPYLACPKHHPAHDGSTRGVSHETIKAAHAAAVAPDAPLL